MAKARDIFLIWNLNNRERKTPENSRLAFYHFGLYLKYHEVHYKYNDYEKTTLNTSRGELLQPNERLIERGTQKTLGMLENDHHIHQILF